MSIFLIGERLVREVFFRVINIVDRTLEESVMRITWKMLNDCVCFARAVCVNQIQRVDCDSVLRCY
jgi:hypothetical protein